jgi:hypothetical protein
MISVAPAATAVSAIDVQRSPAISGHAMTKKTANHASGGADRNDSTVNVAMPARLPPMSTAYARSGGSDDSSPPSCLAERHEHQHHQREDERDDPVVLLAASARPRAVEQLLGRREVQRVLLPEHDRDQRQRAGSARRERAGARPGGS